MKVILRFNLYAGEHSKGDLNVCRSVGRFVDLSADNEFQGIKNAYEVFATSTPMDYRTFEVFFVMYRKD